MKKRPKIHYRNFTRLGATSRWARPVRGEHLRQPTILVAWEFIQFTLAVIGGILIALNASSVREWLILTVPICFLASALLMSIDHPAYRLSSTLSVILGFLALALTYGIEGNLLAILVVATPFIIFITSMYLGPRSVKYYRWCQSKSDH